MTQDKSKGFTSTAQFLDRRLQEVAFIGKTSSQLSTLISFGLNTGINILKSVSVGRLKYME